MVSTSNWPTTTGCIFAIDQVTIVNGVATRVPNTYTEFEGVVTSGTTIGSMVLRYGNDQVYPSGTTTRVYIPVASSRENRQVTGILTQHNQDGTHGAVTATSLSTSASVVVGSGLTVSAGSVVLPANAIANTALAANTAWASWTPTLTNLTVGNGTSVGKYSQIGKIVHAYWLFTLGSTSAVGTLPQISLPVTANAATSPLTTVELGDLGNAGYPGAAVLSGSTLTFYAVNASSTYAVWAGVTASVPFTWGVGDYIKLALSYEAA